MFHFGNPYSVKATHTKCARCPYRNERRFLFFRYFECALPFRRVRYTFTGREKPLACPLVDPKSAELDAFYGDAAGTGAYEVKVVKCRPEKAALDQPGLTGRAPVVREPQVFVPSTPSAPPKTYSEMVAAAATIMELAAWKENNDNAMLGQLFDSICVFGFAICIGMLVPFLGTILPIPAVVITYTKFITAAAQLVAVYAGGSKLIRARRLSSKLEWEQDRLEVELAVALSKSKYTREKIDAAAAKKGRTAK